MSSVIGPRLWSRILITAAAMAVFAVLGPARSDMDDPLPSRISPGLTRMMFPENDGIGDVQDDPAVAQVIRDDAPIGYLFSTYDLVDGRGYAGEPFDIIVGLDAEGRIAGSVLLEQYEPMLGPGTIPVAAMQGYLSRLEGLDINSPMRRRGRGVIDGVSGATISSTLMHGAIVLSARKVARAKGLLKDDVGAAGGLSIDLELFQDADWQTLLDNGAVQLLVWDGEDRDAGTGPASEVAVALATPAGIGRNLFGRRWHNHHLSNLEFGEHLVMVAGRGRYSWRGSNYKATGVFDRVRIIQDDRVILLRADMALPPTALRVAGGPKFNELALLRLSRDVGFDPVQPWRFELLVDAPMPASAGAANAAQSERPSVHASYRLPAGYIVGDDTALEEAGLKEANFVGFGLFRESALSDWQKVWAAQDYEILILITLLSVLTAVLLFQNQLSRHRQLHAIVRIAFLLFVLVWLGWIAGAQLAMVNVFAYVLALFKGAGWSALLFEPLMVIIIGYTLVTLILLGRGVFCGWLCPFGALQELLARLARWTGVPQYTPSFAANERMWMVKYAIVAGLFAAAAFSIELATALAEIEPFKTAITLKFVRAWPYVVYAGLLVFVGLFFERFYCRYICPLGAALSVFGRLHVFDWLRRRPQCGTACHICELSCPVQAIAPNGRINLNECFQCLDCQVDYLDTSRCPPLVADRKRGERSRSGQAAFAG